MIAHAWPELLRVPINRATGLLWYNHQVRKALRPIRRRVIKTLRR